MDNLRKPSGVCRSQKLSGGNQREVTVTLLPGKDYKGNISLKFKSYNANATNWFEVKDSQSRILYDSRGYFAGTITRNLYYDYSLHGTLSIRIRTPNPSIDVWDIELDC